MKLHFFFTLIFISAFSFSQTSKTVNTKTFKSYDEYPTYMGDDLGVTYSPEKTTIKLWSPAVQECRLKIYTDGAGGRPVQEEAMEYDEATGVWSKTLTGNYKNSYYTLQVKHNDKWLAERPDPYAKAVGVNGLRGMIVDMNDTRPESWKSDKRPPLKSYSDIILYEAHVRDFSIHPESGMKYKGKFVAFTEEKTKTKKGSSTGISHLKELGITHIHLLPVFDFKSIDESIKDNKKYNWGYDPQNYFAIEGSYSTYAFDGRVRIIEFRDMIQALHNNGIRVVMDVVFNHTGDTELSVFNQLVPGYYYRQWPDGKFSDASACGNETASERPMVRKFIIDCVKYFVQEFHIDGFRFDLMAIHDIETMNMVAEELRKIDPTIFVYGEGWTAGDSPLPVEKRALKQNAKKLRYVSVFSDDIRDGIKGHWSDVADKGFVSGNPKLKEVVKFGIVASTEHPQVKLGTHSYYASNFYANNPTDVIGYVSCHDNNTLYDKLVKANPDASEEDLIRMGKLANTIVFTSQSVPFLHMGEEMKRTKQGVENSYESPDEINQIDWNWKDQYKDLFLYYKDLIRLRKEHPAFKMPTNELIKKHLKFIDQKDPLLIAYTLGDYANGDSWKEILVLFNGEGKEKSFTLTKPYKILLNGEKFDFDLANTISKSVKIPAYSAVILVDDGKVKEPLAQTKTSNKKTAPKGTKTNEKSSDSKEPLKKEENVKKEPQAKKDVQPKEDAPEKMNESSLAVRDSLYINYFKSNNPQSDGWREMMVLINHSSKVKEHKLDRPWELYFNAKRFTTQKPTSVIKVQLPPKSSVILVQPKIASKSNQSQSTQKPKSKAKK